MLLLIILRCFIKFRVTSINYFFLFKDNVSRGFSRDLYFIFFFRIVTLYPGDLILTGTPSGVGMHRHPAEYLKAGDVLESEIEGIGRMKNKVV